MSLPTPTPHNTDALTAFQWQQQPAASSFLLSHVSSFLADSPFAASLAARLKADTGTRFHDWIDSLFLPDDPALRRSLADVGFQPDPASGPAAFAQPHGVFPRIVLHPSPVRRALLKVDSVATFLAANNLQANIEGEPLSQFRLALISRDPATELGVVERHGLLGFVPTPHDPERSLTAVRCLDAFRTRRRDFDNDAAGFEHADDLLDDFIPLLGRDWVCDLFFEAERQFWMKRNRAAQVQYARQQRLGMGWANHDHHTYRSSRHNFTRLVSFWEKLGFTCRERYHAGLQAGWGAQVMEHPVTGITTFNDVDLAPEELFNDFAHQPLPERPSLGTVGLWCALHGEAFLQAGMHHLECMFDFDALRHQLAAEANIETMKPFTDFPHLRQAFTKGERWPVSETRLRRLVESNRITDDQAAKFRSEGALGSHLENLERNDGFKGFNQKGVSEIISATDPRKHAPTPA